MGSVVSHARGKEPKVPPKVVLVPPLLDRDLKGMARMCKSSYDYLFAKKQLHWLFTDYLYPGGNVRLYLSPNADPRLTVRSTISTSREGVMTVRFQPLGVHQPHTFLELRAALQDAKGSSLRCSVYDPGSGVGAFARLQRLHSASPATNEIGLRYSSSVATAGASFDASRGHVSTIWLAGRWAGVSVGAQLLPSCSPVALWEGIRAAPITHTAPDTARHPLGAAAAAVTGAADALVGKLDAPVAPVAPPMPFISVPAVSTSEAAMLAGAPSTPPGGPINVHWLIEHSSFGISYSPAGARKSGRSTFTAALELLHGRDLLLSFYQHLAFTRTVANLLERHDVVGITNYLDLGLQLHTQLVPEHQGAAAGTEASAAATAKRLQVACAWQVNKGVLLKAAATPSTASAAVVLKAWSHPSVTLAASAHVDAAAPRTPRVGVSISVEQFGAMRYERADAAAVRGAAVTQRHEAGQVEVEAAEGTKSVVMSDVPEAVYNPVVAHADDLL